MRQYLIATTLTALFCLPAAAQYPPPGGMAPPAGTAQPPRPVSGPLPGTLPAPMLGSIVNPGLGFYKSGGVLVGSQGYYPYDTGDMLLGGTEGLARFTGYFAMVYPTPPGGEFGAFGPDGSASGVCAPGSASGHGHGLRHGLFRK